VLYFAAQHNMLEVMQLAIDHGALVDSKNQVRVTVFDFYIL
jgi:hypothetical protein